MKSLIEETNGPSVHDEGRHISDFFLSLPSLSSAFVCDDHEWEQERRISLKSWHARHLLNAKYDVLTSDDPTASSWLTIEDINEAKKANVPRGRKAAAFVDGSLLFTGFIRVGTSSEIVRRGRWLLHPEDAAVSRKTSRIP